MDGTVVYLSSEQLVMVTAEARRDVLRVESYERFPLPMGAMINGVIINDDAVKETILKLKEKDIDQVQLVIDSGQILSKNVVIPKMKMKEVYQFVKDELSPLIQNSEEMIYDFAYLDEDTTTKGASHILALGVEKKLIDSYLQIFDECHIEVMNVDFAINALIRFIHVLPGFIDKTYVISQLDGNNLISTLFDNDEYALTYRTRIMANHGTPEFENEVINSISHMLQSSNRSDSSYRINDVFVFGLDIQEEQSLCHNIHEQLNINASGLPSSKAIYTVKDSENKPFQLSHYIYPVAMFYQKSGSGLKNKELDLLKASNRNDEPSRYERIIKLALPPIIVLLLFLIPYGFLTWDTMTTQNLLDDVNADIEKYNLVTAGTDTTAYEKISSFQNVLNSIQQLDQQISATPIIHSQYITNIQKSMLNGMKIDSISYSRETNSISVTVSSTNVQQIEKCVKLLKKQPHFQSISYPGYNEVTTSQSKPTQEIDPLTGLPKTDTIKTTSYKAVMTIVLE